MARTSNSEYIKRYRDRIEQSRRWRREERYDDLWSRMIDMYRGKHYKASTEEDQLLVNIAFATINVIAPGVSVNYPKITVSAKSLNKHQMLLLPKRLSTIGGDITTAKRVSSCSKRHACLWSWMD
jgi:hypothetical protein